MSIRVRRSAFTLIELLVVIAIIALLLSIIMPSFGKAREQSRSAVCLSNLRQIGIMLQTYSDEDRSAQAIPIHPMMVRRTGQHYLWSTANAFMWGGRDATQSIKLDDSQDEVWLTGDQRGWIPPNMSGPAYGATGRPLNMQLLGNNFTDRDIHDLPIYECPSDGGYAEAGPVPVASRGRRCYDMFGNSYSANTHGFKDDTGAFSAGPWGHRLHTLPDTSQLVLMAEPPFFEGPGAQWHGRPSFSNILFVDGNAATFSNRDTVIPDPESARLMGVLQNPADCNRGLIPRARAWRLDCYPTDGARIWGADGEWTYPFTKIPACINVNIWPMTPCQRNLE